MGSYYNLELLSQETPNQLLALIAERLQLVRQGNELSSQALWMAINNAHERGKPMIERGFHFSPNITIGFRADPISDEYVEGLRDLLRTSQVALEHSQQGVLLFNGEIIVMQKLGGQLTLNADYNWWTDGFRLGGEIWLPHEVRSLPSPLL